MVTEPATWLQDRGVKGGPREGDSGELAALLSREQRAHPTSTARQARVWSRLDHALGLGPQGPDGGGTIGAPPVSSTAAPAAASPRMSAVTKTLAKLTLAACFFGVAGALWGVTMKSAPPVASVQAEALPDRELAASTSVTVVPVVSVTMMPVESLPTAPPIAVVARRMQPAKAGTLVCTICEERTILEAGRRGLRDADHDLTLAKIAEHEQRYPAGQLAEERESLRVHALVAMGRAEEAERQKAQFQKKFPESPLLESVKRVGSR